MYKLLMFFLFLVPTSSYADQDIGDRVIYRLILDGRDQGIVISDLNEKISEDSVLRETQLYIEDEQEFFTSEIFESDLATMEGNSSIIKKCKIIGGKPENIYVAGRISKTCKLSIHNEFAKQRLFLVDFIKKDLSEGYVWIGQAPIYGIVKLNSPELIMDLTYFRWN
jgi:hypothetical protein